MTLLPYAMIRELIAARTKRLYMDMDMIAGYAPPAELVMGEVMTECAAILRQIAVRGRCPLLLHDLAGLLPPGSVPGAVFFETPHAEGVQAPDNAAPAAPPRVAYDLESVDLGLVRSHAEFIADSDADTLRRMSPILGDPAYGVLRRYWHDQIDRLRDDEFSEWLQVRAKRLLVEAYGEA
ncbi:MAG: hypothetical protein AAF074_10935 [Pseudomonadota bacterium]